MKHCFDLYSVRVRRKHHKSNELLREFGKDQLDLYLLISDFVSQIDQFKDHEDKKTLALKDSAFTDDKQSVIYGFLRSGGYGTSSEIVSRKTKKVTATVGSDDANVYRFFFLFYIPVKSTTGALIIHRIGNHGVFSLLKEQLLTYFGVAANDSVVEIEPVHFKLTKDRKFTLSKLEAVFSRKKTATEKVGTNDVSPSRRTFGRFILEVGHDAGFIKQLFGAEDAKEIALDRLKPFLKVTRVNDYDLDLNAKVEMGGLKKTIKINQKFQYNTSLEKTDDLKYENGRPTLDSLLKEAMSCLHMMKENNQL